MSNKEYMKQYMKEYYKNHRKEFIKKAMESYNQNKEEKKEYFKEYYKENIQDIKEKRKKYREENKILLSERKRQSYKENPKKYKDYSKKYYEEHKKSKRIEVDGKIMKNYRSIKSLINDIENGVIKNVLVYKRHIMTRIPVLSNGTTCFVENGKQENYINVNSQNKVTRFCVEEEYLDVEV